MSQRPTCERPPQGLSSFWWHVWDHALRVMQEQGSWAWELKPLLDEYVMALKAAEDARVGFGWLDALERYVAEADDPSEIAWGTLAKISAGLPVQWDRHTKRAMALADQLALTARGRKAAGIGEPEDDEPEDPFADLDDGARKLRSIR